MGGLCAGMNGRNCSGPGRGGSGEHLSALNSSARNVVGRLDNYECIRGMNEWCFHLGGINWFRLETRIKFWSK